MPESDPKNPPQKYIIDAAMDVPVPVHQALAAKEGARD
jgi:hypothetical protein